MYELLVGLEVQRVDLELVAAVDSRANPGASPRAVRRRVERLQAMVEADLHRVIVEVAVELADLHRVTVEVAVELAAPPRVTVEVAVELADPPRVTVEAAVHRVERRGELVGLVA